MKRHLALPLILTALWLCFSCDPDGTEIGDLYGRWHLKSAVSSTEAHVALQDTLFIGFQGNAYQYQAGWGHHDWGSYIITADSLVLNPLAYGGDFSKLGVRHPGNLPLGFQLQTLTDKNLILSRHDTVWTFKKFLE